MIQIIELMLENLRVGKDFSSWIKKQINRCDLIGYQDFEVFTQGGGKPTRRQTNIGLCAFY